jgi:hypothetical protein
MEKKKEIDDGDLQLLEGRKAKSKYCFLDRSHTVHALEINSVTKYSIKYFHE